MMILMQATQRAAAEQTHVGEYALLVALTVAFIVFWGYIEHLKIKVLRRKGLCEVGCGRPYACDDCLRCDERSCNAGCISCRPRSEWDPLSRALNRFGERVGLNNYSKRGPR